MSFPNEDEFNSAFLANYGKLWSWSDEIALLPVAGLFRRVILMSGSLFAPWARVRDPRDFALQLAKAHMLDKDSSAILFFAFFRKLRDCSTEEAASYERRRDTQYYFQAVCNLSRPASYYLLPYTGLRVNNKNWFLMLTVWVDKNACISWSW